ncbi:Gfo/Idh/MocA family oxidoreductase [Ornithinimicrobium sufpigmenti]|uniref:Gfo/Idh/MocA family oxidoreductase n=1 Tax=Ornithinimicrobium sufpigmenti TaxID=2508882 RepID=UPI0010361F50|nr:MULTISPECIES: Gfo/Idh/MocA family oxidoreductase [unclassified Ornithinimicrobium]
MRVGLTGVGRVGEVHLKNLCGSSGVSEVLVHDAHRARAESVAEEHGARVVTSFDDLLCSVDALVVASPTETHADILDRAIARGVPTFCEKPVSTELVEIADLAVTAAQSQTDVQVGFHYRFDPALRTLAAGLSTTDGPHQVRVHSTTEFAPSQEYLAGAGGLILDKLIHELDMLRWLTGAEVSHVSALALSPEAPASEPMTASLTLQLNDGGLATIWGAYRSSAGFDLTVEVENTGGVQVMGSRRPATEMPTQVGPSKITDFRDRFATAYELEMTAFLDLAQGTGKNPSDLDEAVRTHQLVEAARTALLTGTVVAVEDISPRQQSKGKTRT